MPNGNHCQLVKLHLVAGEQVASINVENVICPDEQVKKVDHIDVVVKDLKADPIFTSPAQAGGPCPSPKDTVHFYDPTCTQPMVIRRINVSGTIHKQVYYVNRNDDVRHMPEDIPFTRSININPPITILNPNNVEIDFRNVDVDLTAELMGHNRIRQNVNVSFLVKVLETRQLWAIICAPPNGPVLGIEEETFEDWIGDCPALWDCVNVCPSPKGRTGLGAALGCCPTLPASLLRTVPGIVAGTTYELTFWARSKQTGKNPCDFTLVAQFMFLDGTGNLIQTVQETVTAQQLNDTYRQFRFAGTAPQGTGSVMVGFVFTPQPWNTCMAIIDDVSFGPTGL